MLRLSIALAAASAVTAFQVNAPNADTWWVAQSQNVFTWSCQSDDHPQDFTVLIGNTDTTKMAASQAIVAISQNADCSKILTPQQVGFEAGTGYTLTLANPLNNTVYAVSEPFEIKASGSAYPTTTVIPGASQTASGSDASASSTDSASDSTTTDNGALKTSVGLGVGAFGAILGLMIF